MDERRGESNHTGEIAGFWRRLSAFAFDLVLLLIVGTGLGALLFDPLARMGPSTRLIGFAIALAYFGIGNSRIAEGQTFGKFGFGLRVVDAKGGLLSLPRSMLRYTVLGVPFFLNGLPLDTPQPALLHVLALIVFGGMLSITYLYIFNRRTRQSLHDLVAGSYVVQAAPDAPPDAQRVPRPRAWRGHFVVAALLALVGLASPALLRRFSDGEIFADLIPMQRALVGNPHVRAVQVTRMRVFAGGGETQYLKSRLSLDAPMLDDAEMARSVAQQMAKMDSNLAAEDAILVDLVYGYDMVIASRWNTRLYRFKPGDL